MSEERPQEWTVAVPGRDRLVFRHLVLDLNGTVACDGIVLPGVVERVHRLNSQFQVHLATADLYGRGLETATELGATLQPVARGHEAEQKGELVRRLGGDQVVALGNGSNDVQMLAEAALGIAVMGTDGLSVEALQAADLLVPDILTGLDLLLHPQRLVATWRR